MSKAYMKNPQGKVIVIRNSNVLIYIKYMRVFILRTALGAGTGLSWFFKDFCDQKFHDLLDNDVCNMVIYAGCTTFSLNPSRPNLVRREKISES